MSNALIESVHKVKNQLVSTSPLIIVISLHACLAQCQCEAPLKRIVYPLGGEACVNASSSIQLGERCDITKGEVCAAEHSKCYNGVCVCTCGYTSFGNTCGKLI